ncbi:MAG: DNA translocase FtsK 4TM domain-containing protein, partial [Opitutales bacterium]
MPKAERSNPKDNDPSFEAPRHRPQWLAGFACLVVGLLLLVALVDFVPEQTTLKTSNPVATNLVGLFGAYYSAYSYYLLGAATWLVPVFLFWMTYIYLRSARKNAGARFVAMVICIISLSALVAMQVTFFTNRDIFPSGPGGALGRWIYDSVLKDNLGVFGAALILGTVYLVGMLFIFTRDIGMEVERLVHLFAEWRQKRAALKAARIEELRRLREQAAHEKAIGDVAAATTVTKPGPTPQPLGLSRNLVVPKTEDPFAQPATADTPPTAAKPAPEPIKLATPARPATDTKPLAVAAGK